MKKLHRIFLLTCTLLAGTYLAAQDGELPEPSLNMRYFNVNGNLQYLKVNALVKEDNRLVPVIGLKVNLYLDETTDANLVGQYVTDEKGQFKAGLPAQLQSLWNTSANHSFLATSAATKQYAAGSSEMEVGRAKFLIDTANNDGTREVTATLLAFTDGEWKSVADADVKLAVRRLGGDLNIGEETYTTDSAGVVTGEFSLENLPATDTKNDITLVARTEDLNPYGNVIFEKTVPWGLYQKAESNFGARSLWASRDKAPVWLLLLANVILISVWAVLFYLVYQIRAMRKAGNEVETEGRTVVKRRIPEAEIQ